MGIEMSPENSPVACDGNMKYEEAEEDWLSCKIIEMLRNEMCGVLGHLCTHIG